MENKKLPQSQQKKQPNETYQKPLLDVKKLDDLAKAYATKSGMSSC